MSCNVHYHKTSTRILVTGGLGQEAKIESVSLLNIGIGLCLSRTKCLTFQRQSQSLSHWKEHNILSVKQ